MCRVLGVSSSGNYAGRTRARSERARADEELSLRIQAIHQRSRAPDGAPRIHAELADQGIRVGRKRVARLMEVAGIYGVSRRKWITTTTRDRAMRPARDLVERNFRRASPERVVGLRPHLHSHLDGLSISGSGARRVPPQSSRVGDGNSSAHGTGVSGAQYGARTAPARGRDSALRAGYSIHFDRVRDALPAGRGASRDGFGDGFDTALAESFCATLECELLERRSFKTQAPRHPWRSLTSSRAGTILIVATPRSAISRRSITNATMELRPTNLAVRGRHAHRWAAKRPGGRRGAQRPPIRNP